MNTHCVYIFHSSKDSTSVFRVAIFLWVIILLGIQNDFYEKKCDFVRLAILMLLVI
jgi:hypothetical protein